VSLELVEKSAQPVFTFCTISLELLDNTSGAFSLISSNLEYQFVTVGKCE